jgi:hypothetical protein
LVDDELGKITKEMGWKAKEQIDGGVPWM